MDFVNEEDAVKAIEKLNGMQIQNKRIKVSIISCKTRFGDGLKGEALSDATGQLGRC